MKPTKCNTCQGQDLYYGKASEYTAALKSSGFALSGALPKYAVCLTCGAVQMYLPSDQLEKVKKWKENEAPAN